MRERLTRKKNTPEREAPRLEAKLRGLGGSALRGVTAHEGVEAFRKKETRKERMQRFVDRMVLGGPNATRGNRSSIKPHKYDAQGYTAELNKSVREIASEQGGMPAELYDVANEAAGHLNGAAASPDVYTYTFVNNDPSGVESAGVLRAITHTPAFIEKPAEAAEVLTSMDSSVESSISRDMFTHYDPYQRREVLNDGYSKESLPDFEALIAEDALWEKKEDGYGHGLKAEWALSSMAEALSVMAETSPTATVDVRINMLTRNLTGEAKEAKITHALVYGFKMDEEKERLQALAQDENTPEEKKRVIDSVLGGAWDGTAWAI